MASLKDVARVAGVSCSTASRVMNGDTHVRDDSRSRVLAAVEELRYQPNLFARGLRTRSGKLIGFVVPEVQHETFSTFIAQVEEACADRGFTMILGNTHDDPALEERVLASLVGLHVDGIIISLAQDRSRLVEALEASDIPIVAVDRAVQDASTDRVEVDNREAGRMAARYLHTMGHEALALIAGPQTVALSRERTRGFREFLSGVGVVPLEIAANDFDFESGARCLRALLERGASFSGLWAQSDLLAIGALQELQRLGIRVPDDVSVMGMDDIRTAQMVTPALTTVRQPFRAIARKALDALLRRMKDPSSSPTSTVLTPELVIRSSVRRLQASGPAPGALRPLPRQPRTHSPSPR